MEWTKMTRDDQHIRKIGNRLYEVLDIIPGANRSGDTLHFVTCQSYELDSYSDDCIFDYVRLFGYSSVEDVTAQHPDDPDMYIVEAIATVTSSYNRDADQCYESIEHARDFVNRRWLNKKKPTMKKDPSLDDLVRPDQAMSFMYNPRPARRG